MDNLISMKNNIVLIKKHIEKLINKGVTNVAIYPYGFIGKQTVQIIKENFPELNYIIFDQKYDNKIILNPQLIGEFKDCHFFVTTINNEIKRQVVSHLLDQGIKDIQIIKMFDYDELFLDDRIDRNVNQELVEKVRCLRTYSNVRKKNVVDKEKIIVSLTSFPARINHIEPTIKSLLQQSLQPDKVVLWLAEDEFSNKLDSLPDFFSKIDCDFFEICWCKNLKSYKKLVPPLINYPNAVIVTADDDLIYGRDWLKKLYDTHLEYPEDIICHRITKIVKDKNGRWATLPGGFDYYSGASFLNKLCGGSGTLYPIGSLFDDVIEDKLFSILAPTSDDIWFWMMGILAGYKVRVAKNPEAVLFINKELEDTPKLSRINDHGEKFFWIHFYQILSIYPEVLDLLETEYIFRKGVLG